MAKPAGSSKSSRKSGAAEAGHAKAAGRKSSTSTSSTAVANADTKRTRAAPKNETEKPGKTVAAKRTAPKNEKAKPASTRRSPARTTARRKSQPGKAAAQYAERPWLKSYPSVVPHEIAPLRFGSLGELMVDACAKYADRPAFTSMGKSLTFAEIERMSAAFGAYLQGQGLPKGARVALMMPNVLQYPIAMMGILRAGYTVVNVNPLYTARELEHQLKDSGAEAIVILENFAATLQSVIARTAVKHVVVAAMGDLLGLKGMIVNLVVRRVRRMVPAWSIPGHVRFNDALAAGMRASLKPVSVAADDIAFLQYTGGTTGVSKGAMLLHRNVNANVMQNALWVESAYRERPRPESQIYICALPLYHIFALTVNALMGMEQGANNVLIPNPRDIPAFVAELKKYRFHVFPGLNTLFNALLNNEEFRKLDFSELRLTLGGGMAVQAPVAKRWKELTGCNIAEGYGLSETSPVVTANLFGHDFTGTIGLPLPSTDVFIRDDDGKDVPIGEVGEICIRGPQVMAGYWNRPDETAKVMTKDGFFKSGDMGYMDEFGYVKIVDRKKDMILVSGFNVYPNEIEEIVAHHPGVLEAAVIGVPDEHSGEVPKLFVVRKDPALTEEDVLAYCKQNLTGYKRPKYIEFRSELPKTNVGKILRRKLRE